MERKEFAFVVHLLMFYAIQCQDLKSMRLVMNPSFTSMLLASFQEYIIERNGISRMQCFFLCLQHNSTCAGTLANDEPLQAYEFTYERCDCGLGKAGMVILGCYER